MFFAVYFDVLLVVYEVSVFCLWIALWWSFVVLCAVWKAVHLVWVVFAQSVCSVDVLWAVISGCLLVALFGMFSSVV